ncbi:DUF7064 domain-containing protein [Novosphingobium colocasiae]|uniref:AttH domain-containing protein n=1 Tax=Novosphingobium colocasiae TaxID=1256513 RepID=A0A918UDA7_9SPHN|nr:hypothetical protein [Novosphingobium colocasiae]GGY92447.1 hypothetical protein GCM10011614_04050 [Novosphingobium colocasiae]
MRYEDVTTDCALLDPADDGRHKLRDEPLARESTVFCIELPEHGIAGWVYPRVTGDGLAGGTICAFGPGVPGGSIFESFRNVPVADDACFKDWDVGGVRLTLGDPLRTAHIVYTGERVAMDFTFEATHPAYSYDSHPDGCPQYFADNRFEQSGRVKGTITIEGRTIPFDTLGQRDHSWGTRNWGVNYHYKWFHATGEDSAIHFFKMEYLGRHLIRGYVYKDGHMSQIADVDVIDFVLDQDMIHKEIEVSIKDVAGRTTHILSKHFAHQVYPIDELNILNEVATTTVIDGKPGLGWCEMYWDSRYLAHMKQHAHIRR